MPNNYVETSITTTVDSIKKLEYMKFDEVTLPEKMLIDDSVNDNQNNVFAKLTNLSNNLKDQKFDEKSSVKKFIDDWSKIKNDIDEIYDFLRSVKKYKKFFGSRINPLVKELDKLRVKYEKEKKKSLTDDGKESKFEKESIEKAYFKLFRINTSNEYLDLSSLDKGIKNQLGDFNKGINELNNNTNWMRFINIIKRNVEYKKAKDIMGTEYKLRAQKTIENIQLLDYVKKEQATNLYKIAKEELVKKIEIKLKTAYDALCAAARFDSKREAKTKKAESGKVETGLIPWYNNKKHAKTTQEILSALVGIKNYIPKKGGLFGKSRLIKLEEAIEDLSNIGDEFLKIVNSNP